MTQEKQNNTTNNENRMKKLLVVIKNKIAQVIRKQHQPQNTKKEVESINQQRTLNNLTFFLALFTFIQILVGLLMWYQVSNQTPAIIKATELANQNFESAQRSYLKIGNPITNCGLKWFEIPIENYGNSICNYTIVDIRCNRANPKHPSIGGLQSSRIDSSALPIFPKQIRNISVFLPTLSGGEIDSIEKSLINIHVIGTIMYDAGFNKRDVVDFTIDYNSINKKWTLENLVSIINFRK